MKMVFEIGYCEKGNDNVVYHERHTAEGFRDEQDAFNAMIRTFNRNHPFTDRIDYIERLNPDRVIRNLHDILTDYGNGTLIFTDADFTVVQDAIDLIEMLKGE